MASGKTAEQLIARRRLAEALMLLEDQKKQNRRIYGVDESLCRVQKVMKRADAAVSDAQGLANQGLVRQALGRLRAVQDYVLDHNGMCLLLSDMETRINDARQLREKTAGLIDDGQWQEARTLAEQALEKDSESRTARRQLAKIRQVLRDEAIDAQNSKRVIVVAVVGAFILVVGVIGAFVFNHMANQRQAVTQEILAQAESRYQTALTQIDAERYTEASKDLVAAAQVLQEHDLGSNPLFVAINQTRLSEEMKQGLAGRVPLGNQWVTSEQRSTTRVERKTLWHDIDSLIALIQMGIHGKLPRTPTWMSSDQTSVYSRFSQFLEDTYIARESLGSGDYDASRDQYQQTRAAVQAYLKQSGLILFEGQWRNTQQVKQIRQERRIAAQQAERERQAAAELAERKRQAAAQQAERERRAVIAQSKRERQAKAEADHKEKMRRLAPQAYTMSQKFITDVLKAPSSAIFPPYLNDDVRVVEGDTKGHFLVKAYVDAQNGLGVMIRKVYYIELWPPNDDGSQWNAKTPVLVNN